MAQKTYIARKGQDADFDALTVNSFAINGVSVVTALLLASGQVADLNGEADALILDADADTSISAPTDDQIDIEIAGADDFRITANTFTALSGSTIATNTIAETTAATGVTIDGALVKDGVVFPVPTEVTADGAIAIPPGNTTYVITKAGVAAMTLVDPASGDNGKTLTFISATAQAHTLDNSAGSGFNNAGAGGDVATWGGAIGDGIQLTAWGTKWLVNYVTNVTFG